MADINLIPGENGVRLSTLSPKYLHTNSTSHTWPFSAVAELIDNAYDPDVDASQLWIDIERYGFEQCLTFTDNGAGMDSLKLHKMLSFGFCEKVAVNDHLPVGHYGNGFKSGSMRLGKDAIVFTKHNSSRSVGFLSQTYLEAVKAQTILVPIVSWDAEENIVERADGDKALQDILRHGLFKTEAEITAQFNKIKSSTGTRILIANMRRTQEGKYEFDFRSDPYDIKIPDDVELESFKYKRQERQYHIPESDYSLKAYCSILYLKPRMQIILRGKKVKTTVIAKSLSKTEVDTYKPQGVSKPIKVTFGFSQNKNHYGIMMYHRNRLIKPYVRVGYQLKANNLGVGVIGVIQCDYLQPTHNKQDFDYTKAYRSSMSALGSKLNDYWNEKKGRLQANSTATIPEPKEVESLPDQLWVQCDNPGCLKWRKLPHGISPESLPEKWYCTDHPEEKWRSCDVPEELEDDAEQSLQPYVKKQKKRLEKELEEKKRREKEAKVIKELELEVKSKELNKKEAEIRKLIQIVENKSKQQQQQQQEKGGVKKEVASPQKLQIKVVQPTIHRQQQTTPTKKIAIQSSSPRAQLSPVASTQTLGIRTPINAGTMTTAKAILQKPNNTQQSVQIVKVVSAGGSPQIVNQKKPVVINLAKVTMAQPGLTPQVNGPPVILKINKQAAAEQIKHLPTMVPINAVVDPSKVVSVQSLVNAAGQQNRTTNILIKELPTNPSTSVMSTTGTIMGSPVGAMATPGVSMLTGKAATAEPGTAMTTLGTVVPATQNVTAKTVTSMATAKGAMATAIGALATPDSLAAQVQVKKEPGTVNVNSSIALQTVVKTELESRLSVSPAKQKDIASIVKKEPTSPSVSCQKRKHDQGTDNGEPVSRRQKNETDVIIIDPPSPPLMNPISPEANRFGDLLVTGMDSCTPNMDTSSPNMDTSSPNMDTSSPNMEGSSPKMNKQVDKILKDCNIINIDKEVVDEIKSMSPKQQLQALLSRSQQLKQLYSLRENILKLLRVLVPELEVTDDLKEKYDDQMVDELLKQVLDQAEKTDIDS